MPRTKDSKNVKHTKEAKLAQIAKEQSESRAYKLFSRSINSPLTLKTYNKGLGQFRDFSSLTYDEIAKLDTEDLQTQLENWVMDMADRGLRRSSILAHLSGVEKFLDINRKLFWKKPLHALIKQDRDLGGGTLPYENTDIQKMLKAVANKKRDTALIHFFASTGTRPQALIDPILRKKHLIEMPNNCYAIRIYDNTKEGYWSFLTPEAKLALDDYLAARKRNGESITDESPLFASVEKTATYQHMTVSSSYMILFKALRKANISREKTGNRFDKALVYGFRKRFNTILKINNEVNSNIAEKLMAHKRGLDGRYLTPTREECFTEFQKAIFDLTVDDSKRKSLKIEKLEQEKSELEITRIELERMKNDTSNTEKTHKANEDKIKSLEEITRNLMGRLQKQESITDEITKIHIRIKETINRESDPSNPHFPDGSPLDTKLVNLELHELDEKSMTIFDSEFGESINVVLRKDKVYCTLDKSATCKHVLFALGNPDFYSIVKKNNADVLFSITS